MEEVITVVDYSAWLTAGATVVLAGLTFWYVRLTQTILQSQRDPYVIVTVVHDEYRPSILQLVIRNVGNGLARNIRFDVPDNFPKKAWGIEKAQKPKLMTSGPLIDGIPALGPGECRKFDWGQYGGLSSALEGKSVSITCHFSNDRKALPPVICILDVKSFEGTVANSPVELRKCEALEKIAKNIESIERKS